MLAPDKVKVAVATIIKPHGIKGEFSVELTDMADPESDFAPGACLLAEIEGLEVPYFVASARPRGAESYLLMFDDVDSEADAAELAGLTLYACIEPDEAGGEELTAGHMVGYTLYNDTDGRKAGIITETVELTPGNWYFRLDDGNMPLIPAVNDLIEEIDGASRTIRMNLPDGLLEL